MRQLVRELARDACLTQDDIASRIGISRPQLTNALHGRFGLSPEPADRLMAWLAQPRPIRQMSLI
jgi:transcriptional regulator with XRE-family HTH domain